MDFQNILEPAISDIKSGYVLFLDLDNFKYINDAFGHEKGDELLIQVAQYLSSMTVDKITAYRYGGDEFIMVADDMTEEYVMELANKLIERFSQPWMLSELEYFCTASIGVANYPKDGFTYDELLTAADKAMYSAKNSGKASIKFADDNNRISVRLKKEFALRKAILDNFSEFVLMYHPIVDAKTGRWSGTEVLPRWISPLFGVVYREDFGPLGEEIGLIGPFEEWVLQQALKEVSQWKLQEEFFLSLNISSMQLKKESFSDSILQMLKAYRLPHVRLMLELASGPKYDESIIRHLEKLRSHGVYVAFDGFGIGNSTLESIQNFAVDFIKVDKSLIMGFIDDKLKTTIVEAIIMIAHAASAKVCAEGVETEKHLAQLQEINCDYAQGVYFLEPVTAAEFISKMKESS